MFFKLRAAVALSGRRGKKNVHSKASLKIPFWAVELWNDLGRNAPLTEKSSFATMFFLVAWGV
jgi:hypothetical protein